jgi:hypothetical protein
MYLAHDADHATPPLFPMQPFGFTALEDTSLDVQLYAKCGAAHQLEYHSFTWACEDGEYVQQGITRAHMSNYRPKHSMIQDHATRQTLVDYGELDFKDEVSEMATRNIFTWLRGEDGFPVAERAIRQHEWIDNLQSDDDSPIEGDSLSVFGSGKSGRWLLGLSTHSSSSI